MTVGELKKLLEDIPDNFEFRVLRAFHDGSAWGVSQEYYSTDRKDYDIGWSEEKIHVVIREEVDNGK